MRAHQEATATLDFIPEEQEITAHYDEGTAAVVTLHDGSTLHLSKLATTGIQQIGFRQ
ncbi:MAG: hypothetical protein R2795_03340 [Saprospiraceae bacterium]